MVHGVATGWGFDLALACDMRLGSENTRFMAAFTRVGLTLAAGGAWMLPRIVGLPKATEIILSADFVGAE
jgi:enoyl-CoA hydratase/carnithine racemase